MTINLKSSASCCVAESVKEPLAIDSNLVLCKFSSNYPIYNSLQKRRYFSCVFQASAECESRATGGAQKTYVDRALRSPRACLRSPEKCEQKNIKPVLQATSTKSCLISNLYLESLLSGNRRSFLISRTVTNLSFKVVSEKKI